MKRQRCLRHDRAHCSQCRRDALTNSRLHDLQVEIDRVYRLLHHYTQPGHMLHSYIAQPPSPELLEQWRKAYPEVAKLWEEISSRPSKSTA